MNADLLHDSKFRFALDPINVVLKALKLRMPRCFVMNPPPFLSLSPKEKSP